MWLIAINRLKALFKIYINTENIYFQIIISYLNITVLLYLWTNKCSLCEHKIIFNSTINYPQLGMQDFEIVPNRDS